MSSSVTVYNLAWFTKSARDSSLLIPTPPFHCVISRFLFIFSYYPEITGLPFFIFNSSVLNVPCPLRTWSSGTFSYRHYLKISKFHFYSFGCRISVSRYIQLGADANTVCMLCWVVYSISQTATHLIVYLVTRHVLASKGTMRVESSYAQIQIENLKIYYRDTFYTLPSFNSLFRSSFACSVSRNFPNPVCPNRSLLTPLALFGLHIKQPARLFFGLFLLWFMFPRLPVTYNFIYVG